MTKTKQIPTIFHKTGKSRNTSGEKYFRRKDLLSKCLS